MGIDKSDVRYVVHLDLPDCLKHIFRKRAGEVETRKAHAILLSNRHDRLSLGKISQTHILK